MTSGPAKAGASPILYPNVSSVPPKSVDGQASKDSGGVKGNGEFQKLFDAQIQGPASAAPALKFSAHATQRLQDRKINLDSKTMGNIREAVEKAEAKGLEDTLILTKDAALIVNVKNKTVVTAMDREALKGNVFTNIDGAVIV